ncbi:FGGY family carbohydrate kinase, partial [Mangrovicoccus algicola]
MAATYCAVDVGTGSARAALFDGRGAMLGRAEAPLRLLHGAGGAAEYDAAQIWTALCRAVAAATAQAGADPRDVAGLGIGATCSLVLSTRDGAPLRLAAGGDTFAWCDRRATAEAAELSAISHRVIALQGGRMSPEMHLAKLLWLRRRAPGIWARLDRAEDLADHLLRRATGAPAASGCALAVKWPYLPGKGGWQQDFLADAGLEGLPGRLRLPAAGLPAGAVVA